MDDDAFNKYAPLIGDENTPAPTLTTEAPKPDDGELVSPVPPGAPEPPPTHLKRGKPTGVYRYLDASGAILQIVYRFDRRGKKKVFSQCTLRRFPDGLRWCWKGFPAPRPLYGLDKLAARPDTPVVIVEGEKAAEAAVLIFPDYVVVTSSGGAGAAAETDWTPLVGRHAVMWPDNDKPGTKYAHAVAEILKPIVREFMVIDAAPLAVVDGGARGQDWDPDGWDAADALAEWKDIEALRRAVLSLAAPHVAPSSNITDGASGPNEEEVKRRVSELSLLSELGYALERAKAAKALGISVSVLDRLVKGSRTKADNAVGGKTATSILDPWPCAVNGVELLDGLASALKQYVILTSAQADALTLWIAFTHAHDAFDVSPRLVVTSAQKRSGKSTLFSALERVVARPRATSGISPSALMRLIDDEEPTLLLDEMDALMGRGPEMAEALRGLLNSGFNRDKASFIMSAATSDGDYKPRIFSTWCPTALAGIGNLPDTVRDRSVEIMLKRKLQTERVNRLRRRDGQDLNELARKLQRWSADSIDSLRIAEPAMPGGLNDRAADAWEPLVAIADTAGGPWPARARAAAIQISGEDGVALGEENIDAMLLADIREAFGLKAVDRLSSEELASILVGLEDRPWAEFNHGKPITKHQMSKRLKPYGVLSATVRFGKSGQTAKGYHFKAFEDAFSRYLPCPSPSTRHIVTSPEKQRENEVFEPVTPLDRDEVKGLKNPSNPGACDDVTSSAGLPKREGPSADNMDASPISRPKVIRL